MPNMLSNMPSVWGDLGLNNTPLAQQNQQQLSDAQKMRKKKIMSAGDPMQSATQVLLGGMSGM